MLEFRIDITVHDISDDVEDCRLTVSEISSDVGISYESAQFITTNEGSAKCMPDERLVF